MENDKNKDGKLTIDEFPDPERAKRIFDRADTNKDGAIEKKELDALADVFQAVQQDGDGEDDVILLGDLNVNERHLGRLGKLRDIKHALSSVKTNTRGTKSYDNIVFNGKATVEYTGRFGVLDLMREFHLSKAEALKVSDHMPVWAVFSSFENAGAGVESARRGSAAPH